MITVVTEKLENIVSESFTKVAGDKRWFNAISKAVEQIDTNPYLHYENHSLLILSESGLIYRVGVGCECKAFPCWHRALKRLLDRYNEEMAQPHH